MNALLLKLIRKYDGRFKVSFSISGTALDQFEAYAPEVIQSFRELVATGCVELLSETYNHSLAFLYSPEEFREQVALHDERIEALFGVTPRVFRNTELIYNNDLARAVEAMGYKAVLAEGADQRGSGWRSPNFVYRPAGCDRLKLLLKNYRLSDDIAFRFSNHQWPEFPLTADQVFRVGATPPTPPGISSICSWITRRSGSINGNPPVFSPLWKPCPRSCCGRPVSRSSRLRKRRPGSSRWRALDVPHFMSWADAERDLTAWLGNDMQNDAIESVYRLEKAVKATGDPGVLRTWRRLPDLRPFLLHVHEVVLGRRRAQLFQPLRHAVRRLHQLYECARRFQAYA